ncbi:hypothetical protein D3C80_121310 [compost metagenome]
MLQRTDVSMFEQGAALFDAASLRSYSAFEAYPWQIGEAAGFESLVRKKLASQDTLPPGRYSDVCTDDQQEDNAKCSMDDHARRVAWFAQFWYDQFSCDGILLPQQQCEIGVGLFIPDGNHRLAAAVLCDRTISVKFIYGTILDIEAMPGFIEWESKPTPALRFGVNTLSSGTACWEVIFDRLTLRLHVNDIFGRCRLKLQLGKFKSMIYWDEWFGFTEDGKSLMLRGKELTCEAVQEVLSTNLGEVFGKPLFTAWLEEEVGKYL